MTYPEALQYLGSFINYEKKTNYDYASSFKLDRMCRLTDALGSPHKDVRSIHIAGSKGKGSTAAVVHSILKNATARVGLYTSPHLVSFRERIRINDSLISEDETCAYLEKVKCVVEKMKDTPLSFFEIYTALSLLYFKEKNVDVAIYETGLGGRLDATNIIDPLVTAITPISYEHTRLLGHTLREIAGEKAGIVKDGIPCVSAPQDREALDAIKDTCKRREAMLILVGRDILFEELGTRDEKEVFNVFGLSREYPMLVSNLLGTHQVVNISTAIGIVDALRFYGVTIPEEAIRQGVKDARWNGRLEVISKRPYVILDGAQNRASAMVLAKAVKKIFRYKRLILILGVSKDKDIVGMLDELLPPSDIVILTKSEVVERALEPLNIKESITSKDKDKGVILTSNVKDALENANSRATADDLILITGSLFVVGEARHLLVSRCDPTKC